MRSDCSAVASRDGNACVALFEQRGTAGAAGGAIALADPVSELLTNVAEPWVSRSSPYPQPAVTTVRSVEKALTGGLPPVVSVDDAAIDGFPHDDCR